MVAITILITVIFVVLAAFLGANAIEPKQPEIYVTKKHRRPFAWFDF